MLTSHNPVPCSPATGLVKTHWFKVLSGSKLTTKTVKPSLQVPKSHFNLSPCSGSGCVVACLWPWGSGSHHQWPVRWSISGNKLVVTCTFYPTMLKWCKLTPSIFWSHAQIQAILLQHWLSDRKCYRSSGQLDVTLCQKVSYRATEGMSH